jgi:hypothetical protein
MMPFSNYTFLKSTFHCGGTGLMMTIEGSHQWRDGGGNVAGCFRLEAPLSSYQLRVWHTVGRAKKW